MWSVEREEMTRRSEMTDEIHPRGSDSLLPFCFLLFELATILAKEVRGGDSMQYAGSGV